MSELNRFHITSMLCRACLGEITPNFRRIYWERENRIIRLYFYLEQESFEDLENIKQEIVWYFSLYLDQMMESPHNFEVKTEIVLGSDNFLITENLKDFDEVFRRKEILD